jgi:hypothetical protein
MGRLLRLGLSLRRSRSFRRVWVGEGGVGEGRSMGSVWRGEVRTIERTT